jgi:antitoxin component YwqK of YwqJK toxin-antitoxin module
MKLKLSFLLGVLSVLALTGCQKNTQEEDPVVTQRYIHKYGYALTQQEWATNRYPGQVVTTLRNGVTITSTYEGGVLHGAVTHTFPNSQTVESYFLYNQGEKVKEIQYDIQAMPIHETVQISPSRYTITQWYVDGTPLSIEEYSIDELIDGQYFSKKNEIESRVEKGCGQRFCRDRTGVLLSKDDFEGGYKIKRETFYSSGTPESITLFKQGLLHGEKKTFSEKGEPLAIEEWIDGKLHGKATYFVNGSVDYEVSYFYGKKHGPEVHYIDGKTIAKEITWEYDRKHGPTTYFIDGIAKTDWFYEGQSVSYHRYQEHLKLDEMISHVAPETKIAK